MAAMYRTLFHVALLNVLQFSKNIESCSITPVSKIAGLQQRLKQLTAEGGMILLDGDNVRGKTKFKLSKEELCANVENWMESACLYGQVTLIYDHASQHSAYFRPKSGLSVVFSGPGRTADDVISRDSSWIMRKLQTDVIVVTEDNGLKKRCRTEIKGSASARGKKKTKKTIPKMPVQVLTPAQKILLDKMESDQRVRDGEKAMKIETPLVGDIVESVGFSTGVSGAITSDGVTDGTSEEEIKSDEESKKDENNLTFVSSLTFANMILEQFDLSRRQETSSGNSVTSVNDISTSSTPFTPPPFSPLFSSPSSPSPSSTSLDVKGSTYAVELSLLRREVELRKQLTGFETSLLTCNRKAAVKIRARIAQLKEVLMDCVKDGIQAKITYTDASSGTESINVAGSITGSSDDDAVNSKNTKNGKKTDGENKNGNENSENEIDAVIDMSIVDRGSVLLAGALSRGRPEGTIEETWERMILAEKMRFDLDALCSKEGKEGEEMSGGGVGVSVEVGGSSSSSDSVVSTSTCYSSKYASYVNLNYSVMKRLPSVVKA